ncbi:MAG: N-acetylneuraminate synthase family protein [Oceanospirillaceae bacterium]|nr:N-acetylneuraminate synthase family protein [Oceanospirillaceae bacterium]
MTSFADFIRPDRPFVIAEIGNNHEGDMGVARELIYAAQEARVDAVKFQAIVPRKLCSADQTQRIKQLEKFCLTFDEFQELSELSSKLGLTFFTSVFDLDIVDQLSKIQPIFKVSSGDNTYADLIDKLASTDSPVIISTGGLLLDEIDQLRASFVSKQPNTNKLALLHCISNYPTLPENAQLALIETMRLRYPDITIGYSDHTMGNDACFLAAAMGAQILEKHFTMSHTYSDFRDHALSADPKQMSELMKRLPGAYSYSGRLKEDSVRSDFLMTGVRRKAIVCKPILIGEKFSKENVEWLRITEDKGIADRNTLYGSVSVSDLDSGSIITLDNVLS